MKSNRYPDYDKNCGVCKKCTVPDFLEKQDTKCPKCQERTGSLWCSVPFDRYVKCAKCGHTYDIRAQMDEQDIELHQRTIRKMQRFER